MAMVSLQALADDAEQQLPKKKFLHVLGVAHTAVALAMRHGLDPEEAAAAAFIHDRSKALSPERIRAELAEWGVSIPEDDLPHPAIWHGLHGAVHAEREQGLGELEGFNRIAEAVQLHSTADAGIGPLAKVLFLADYLEPRRDFEGVDRLRELARTDLEAAYREALRKKTDYMRGRGKALSARARRALESLDEKGEPEKLIRAKTAAILSDPERIGHIGQVLEGLKAEKIVALDMSKVCDFTDYFIIATLRSAAQMRAALDQIQIELKKHGARTFMPVEDESTNWAILDYGSIVVHLFEPSTRAHYRLEDLWGDAKVVEWRERVSA